jgi:ubiquinone/menaquinone biosynthesis C-methylase UbiE
LAGLPVSGNLLDVGGGTGRVRLNYKDGHQVTIVDSSWDAYTGGKKNSLSWFVRMQKTLPFKTNPFRGSSWWMRLHLCD